MLDLDEVFRRLADSAFRRRFRLAEPERAYMQARGREAILAQAREFIARRLASAQPARDGRQTPFRGHPVFVAQHATGTCCRNCLSRWHGIPAGRVLTAAEQEHVVAVIEAWLAMQAPFPPAGDAAQGCLPLP